MKAGKHSAGWLVAALIAGAGIALSAGESRAQFSPGSNWAAYILPDKAPAPKNNPTTPAKVELGKQLYFDTRLSSTGTVSCNSCHNVMKGGDDNRATSLGVHGKTGGRSAPTVWNSGFLSAQFWDGRAKNLEEQAKGPMVNPVEMGNPNHDVVVKRLQQVPGYVSQFKTVFGGADSLTIDNVAKAIAAYERTLVTTNSPFDRYVKGDQKALTPAALRGMDLVQKSGCTSCHTGPNFAGPPMSEGKGFFMPFPRFESAYTAKYDLKADTGRYTVTKSEPDRHMWRVPTWRNVALTAPYFHNGKVKTLEEAVRVMGKAQLNRDFKDNEVKDIVAFLSSLTGTFPKQTAPKLP